MTLSRPLPTSALVLVIAGCASAPTAPLPDPLPEVLEWARPELQSEGAFIGLEVRENDTGSLEALSFEEGVRVTSVAGGSPATKAGLRAGDVLLAVGEVRMDGPGALDELLAATTSGSLILTVRRGDAAFEVEVQPVFGEGPVLAEPRLAGEDQGLGDTLALRRGRHRQHTPVPAAGRRPRRLHGRRRATSHTRFLRANPLARHSTKTVFWMLWPDSVSAQRSSSR